MVRDADEPYAMENPTSVSGTIDTGNGAITGGSLATPQVNLRQDITNPIPASVFIDADFSLVSPDSAVGSITWDGLMTFQASVRVNLHIDVQPVGGGDTILAADCRTSPVNLDFVTTSPYDPNGAKRITVRDANFSIPPVVEEPACDSLVRGEINNQLAGSGHAISLTLGGDITLPPRPGCPTTAVLVASPEGEAELATPVDLTATISPVASDPLCVEAETNGDVMTGPVHFFDGETQIGSVQVAPDGTATLTTSAIPAGTRSLTAYYEGAFPFSKSEMSPALSYRTTPNPTISATLPDYVRLDAAPTEFEVSVSNTGFGGAITNGRFDITFSRASSAVLETDRLVLERLDATETWVPVPLTPDDPIFGRELFGSIGPATGFSLPVGGEISQRLRVRVLTTGDPSDLTCDEDAVTCPGPIDVTVELVAVDPGSGLPAAVLAPASDAIAASSGRFTIIEATRRESTVLFGSAFSGGPISPYRVRQGGTLSLPNLAVGPTIGGQRPGGFFEFALDGQPLAVRRVVLSNVGPDAPPLPRVPITGNGAVNVTFDIPVDISLGTHQVTVMYSGDALSLPSENTTSFTVVESVGVIYDCLSPALTNTRYRAYVESQVGFPLPLVRPAGSSVSLQDLDLRMLFSRDGLSQNNSRGNIVPNNETLLVGPDLEIGLEFGPGGVGTAEGIERVNGSRLPGSFALPNEESPTDEIMTFLAPSGSLVLEGAPGDVVPVTIDVIRVTGNDELGAPVPMTCTPVGSPVQFGSVTLSGNTLTANPTETVWEGEEVTLTSAVEPYTTGQVEFRDGATTIGVAPVVDGLASMVTRDLPAGTRSLTSVFSGGVLAPAITSNVVELDVVAVECREFAVEGHGATVRLVYLELLGRCPDRAGFDYWVGRLEGGLSAEAFARTIARTPEAVGRVVDDAYRTMLDRPADPAGRVFWTGQLQAHGRYDRLLADLGASGEFWTKAGATNTGFVTRVYERLLQRSPDQGGLDYWVGRLEDGASRRALILTLANLNEPLGVLVVDSYDEILDRAPDGTERTSGISHLRSTGDRSGLYAQLIGQPEFATRAGTFPNPT